MIDRLLVVLVDFLSWDCQIFQMGDFLV